MELILGYRGTLFIDIDGTLLNCSTEEPLPFAVEKINEAYTKGYMIILTTMRGGDSKVSGCDNYPQIPCLLTIKQLKEIGLKYHTVIWNCPSPRIVLNDEGAIAHNHPRDGSWEKYNFIATKENNEQKK